MNLLWAIIYDEAFCILKKVRIILGGKEIYNFKILGKDSSMICMLQNIENTISYE